ncbi:virion structural protein [Vibrio phage BONAISHI]|nr:virion structural protein [Vibrio phage BONAISHI]
MESLLPEARQAIIDNIWANPHVDRQFIFKPSRLTYKFGERGSIRIPFSTIYMPDTDDRYVVYEMGQLNPALLGLDGNYRQWVRLDKVCNNQEALIFGYIDNRIIPSTTVYIRRNENRNLLCAVKYTPNREHFLKEKPFYLRMYSNSWFATAEADTNVGVEVKGGIIDEPGWTVSDILTQWNAFRARAEGYTFAFINGVYHDKLTSAIMTEGDYLEMIYDGSIQEYFDVSIEDMGAFQSDIDFKRKLLITSPDSLNGQFIFQDDVDFMICNKFTENLLEYTKGVYYPREIRSDVRQVTQRDWAIVASRVTDVIVSQGSDIQYTGSYIRCFVRKTPAPDFYSNNAQFTSDMFLLDEATRKLLLTGTGGRLDKWKAEELEKSAWITMTAARAETINDLSNVLNYYGVYKYLETGYKQDDGSFTIPPIMKDGGVIAKLDANGHLIEIDTLTDIEYGPELVLSGNPEKAIFIPGDNTLDLSTIDTPSSFANDVLADTAEVFMYLDTDDQWKTATENIQYYVNASNVVTWGNAYAARERRRRNSRPIVNRSFSLDRSDVGLPINITANGSVPPTNIGFAKYDIWLNKKKLVFGVDFLVDFPKIIIRNQEYFNAGESTALIEMVAHGIPPEQKEESWGFVENRYLSNDDTFNLHFYRQKELVIDGAIIDMSRAAFAEGYAGHNSDNGKLETSFREGGLFSLSLPVSAVSNQDQNSLNVDRFDAQTSTVEIEAYMDKYFPQTEQPNVNIIPYRHSLVSAFMRRALSDIMDGILVIDRTDYSDTAIGLLVEPFSDLLPLDVDELNAKEAYIEIRPHAFESHVALTPEQYNFFVRLNDLYLKSRITLSDFFMQ